MKNWDICIEIGDKVRTDIQWDENHTPITGTVTGFEELEYHESVPVYDKSGDLIYYKEGKLLKTTVVVLDNGEKIHGSWLKLVDFKPGLWARLVESGGN